jgi:hypothetical protein
MTAMSRRAVFVMLLLLGTAGLHAQAPQSATLRQALQAYDNLDFARAGALARRALTERMTGPDQARAYELLGFTYSATDSQAKAVDAFKQAILLDPDRQLDASRISPKITSLFYSALGQVLVVRQLQVDSARFVAGQGAVPIRFTVTSPARVRVRAISGPTALLIDSSVVTGTVNTRWPAQLPSGAPVPAGAWLIVVEAITGQNTFSASRALRISYSPVDTLPHMSSLPGYRELPETEVPPQSWRPLGLAFLFATGTAAGALALNNGGLGSTPGRELVGVSVVTLAAGLVMTLRKPAPRPAEGNILYNRLLHEQLAQRNADLEQENMKRRQQVALTVVPLPKGGGGPR